jgi:stringent starvation protein B
MNMETMTSSRPYLVIALYEWILDNGCTPHIVVAADAEGVEVPDEFVHDGQIVLNISPSAVKDFLMDKEAISFNARFQKVARDIYVPMRAVLGIVTRENGKGMMFDIIEPPSEPSDPDKGQRPTPPKPTLKVVK